MIPKLFTIDYRIKFKRRVMHHLIRYRPHSTASLHRLNADSEIVSTRISNYAMNSTVEILDPRNGRLQNHAFSSRDCFLVNNAIIEPIHGNLYSENGNLIIEGTAWDSLTAYNSFPYSPGSVSHTSVLNQVIYLRSSSFWHWVIEEVPPFLFLRSHFPDTTIVVAKNRPSYVDDLLFAVGADFIEIAETTSFSKLLIVEFGTDSGWPHPADLSLLQSHHIFSQSVDLSPNRRIYISRRNSSRSVRNEEEIEVFFRLNGFEIILLENLDLLNKIQLFRQTRVLAGLHGAGMVGMVWMAEGATVIDIANVNFWTESAHRLASMKKLDYRFLIYPGIIEEEVNIKGIQRLLNETNFKNS